MQKLNTINFFTLEQVRKITWKICKL